jgi:hypothetical protein
VGPGFPPVPHGCRDHAATQDSLGGRGGTRTPDICLVGATVPAALTPPRTVAAGHSLATTPANTSAQERTREIRGNVRERIGSVTDEAHIQVDPIPTRLGDDPQSLESASLRILEVAVGDVRDIHE